MKEIGRTKKVLVLSLGQTLTTVAGIISGMVAARLLTKHDYATMRQTFLAYNFIAPLLMLGLPNALYYFLPKAGENKKAVVVDIITLLFFFAILFSAFLLFGGYSFLAMRFENSDLNSTLKWMIPYPLYVMPASILGGILLTQNRTYELTVFNVINSLLLTGLTILGTIITKDYTGPLFVQIYFPVFVLPIILWLSFRYLPGKLSKPNLESMKIMLKYSAPLGLAGMISALMLETNKIVVAAMCTPEQFAEYVNGAIEIPLISIITGSISSVILVDMTKFIDDGNKKKALELFHIAAVRSATILFPAMIFMLIAGKAFIITIYSDKYVESVFPFYIYLFVLPVRIVIYSSALLSLGFSRAILFRSLLDLIINTILSSVLVLYFGYLGAAFATIITLYLWTVPYNLLKIRKGFEVRVFDTLPFKKIGIVLIIAISTAPIGFVQMLVAENSWLIKLIVVGVLYFPVTLLILYNRKLLPIPNSFLRYVPKKIIKN